MDDFRSAIYIWYRKNRRMLPWRMENDVYRIWVSEVILQQTRVEQGLPYFEHFISEFHDIRSLAMASDEKLMKAWEGLGYYSRARHMQQAARRVLSDYDGRFPETYNELLTLKGVGEYTASAIASIAFGLPHAVVDGNVYRFLARFFGLSDPIDQPAGKAVFKKLAGELISGTEPSLHNQSFMEFGALQCVPRKPNCSECPVAASCYAFNHGVVKQFPVKKRKNSRKRRFFYFWLIEDQGHVVIQKRTGNDIWRNLYQLPLTETASALADDEVSGLAFPGGVSLSEDFYLKNLSPVFFHELTHRHIVARFIHMYGDKILSVAPHFTLPEKKDISKFAFPALIAKYLSKKQII